MSIFIKTMTNLPEHCYECPCHDGESGYCQADEEYRYSSDYRPFWCPLIEISDISTEYEVEIITHGNCMMCGKELDEGLFFCKECEARIAKQQERSEE